MGELQPNFTHSSAPFPIKRSVKRKTFSSIQNVSLGGSERAKLQKHFAILVKKVHAGRKRNSCVCECVDINSERAVPASVSRWIGFAAVLGARLGAVEKLVYLRLGATAETQQILFRQAAQLDVAVRQARTLVARLDGGVGRV